ncbi:Zn-dependent hydrolase, glyoxylase [Candidatus Methanoperedens nitroreducens]|uniref:Zn-dependent hydrolase, glyoxylase n=1 Tax=Candidatus Methanoperedens nitratireducens TaxID=1392998 RepID=A0A062V2D3_9EURY|nr:MBL fold metallo-hydrolase [Candidatus Methanoperedens nitroreducens]KCZ71527.1 Zn-dependent hydrolase, glyoxylase [Candidatus Methanoperedens nitroreducens]MDJ1421156.1 MBL fold metallo-hydrolase [Candidatus Methanoperedens sp.]
MKIIKLNGSPYDANAYLVDDSILIDVGMDARSVITELEGYIQIGDLETIILTHCHYDHTGGAGDVARASGAKIAIHKDDAPLLGNAKASASIMFGRSTPSITPDILLKGGEFFGELEIIHTPGHTPGCICLYNAHSKVLFSGDTVFQDGSFGRTDLYGGSTQQLIESIRKLTLLDVSIMYPGHGDIVEEDAGEQIKMSLMMASQFLDM